MSRRKNSKDTRNNILKAISNSLLQRMTSTSREFMMLKSLQTKKIELLESILIEQKFMVPMNSLNTTEKAIADLQSSHEQSV
jgi:hypothetical protein